MMKKDEVKKLTKTDVKELGFTDKMIKSLLPEPEEKRNPRYSSASPMLLWEEQTVLEIMRSDEFKDLYEKAQKRREGAYKAYSTKYDKTMAEISTKLKELEILDIPLSQIYEEAIESKYEYDNEIGKNEYYSLQDYQCVDQATKDRWAVNYIRHELMDYDYILYLIKGKVGVQDAYDMLYEAVTETISEKYPELSRAANGQYSRKMNSKYGFDF